MGALDSAVFGWRGAWTAVLPLLVPAWAAALQVVDARDGVAVEAIVSIKEPTRIRIEGTPIVDVFGNIHSSSCGLGAAPAAAPGGTTAVLGAPVVNPAGEVVVECDRDKGEIYVRPLPATSDAAGGKPVNLFISSAHATYTLLLRRADTPADTIVIRDRTVRASAPDGAPSSPQGPAPSHLRRMKALLVAMASERPPLDVRVDEVNQPLQLWAESRLILLRRYEGRGLVGEKYLLQNASTAPMVLAEQEFDRPDSRDAGQVLAVAIEHHNLRPGESTHVYVLRRGGER